MELLKEINGWMSVKFLLQRALSPRLDIIWDLSHPL